LVVMGSLVGFTAYAWLLRVAPISLVVTHQYVNPLVAIALGMLFLGERPSAWSLAGALVVIAAVYIAIRAEMGSGLPRSPKRNVEDLTPMTQPASAAPTGTPEGQTA
ncbi:MAG: EamA family transporter, partial [Thermoleophilia bacterium]|nr:EamA family transporter [Thermoleophilia bacterium]